MAWNLSRRTTPLAMKSTIHITTPPAIPLISRRLVCIHYPFRECDGSIVREYCQTSGVLVSSTSIHGCFHVRQGKANREGPPARCQHRPRSKQTRGGATVPRNPFSGAGDVGRYPYVGCLRLPMSGITTIGRDCGCTVPMR